MTPSPTVSLCMIVRDEEATLARAINSVRPLVDEIIVVDTGSVDGTAAVARSCGARVIDFPWCDDFSAARNASLEAATSDWVLVLDADEILEPVDPTEFRRLLAQSNVAGYQLTLKNQGQDQTFSLVRLFRNEAAVRYEFPIHEQVTPSLNTWASIFAMRVEESPLVIRHSGYEPSQRQAKKPRNRRLLTKALVAHPEEPYLHFQLGAEGVSVFGQEVLPVAGMRAAAASLEQAWNLTAGNRENSPWLPDLAALLSSSRLILGDVQGSLEVLAEAGKILPGHQRLALPLCLTTLEIGRRDQTALANLSHDISALGITLEEDQERRVLGDLEIILGNQELARNHYQSILEVDPEDTFALLGMARSLLADNRHTESLGYYLKSVTASEWNWRAWLQGARLMQRVGLKDQAAQWRATFDKQFPDHPEAQRS